MRRVLAVAAAAAALGCGSSSTEPTTVYGTYSLQTINGTKLPVVIYDNGSGGSEAVISGNLTLRSDSKYVLNLDMRVSGNLLSGGGTVEAVQTDSGSFTQAGSSLTLAEFNATYNTKQMQWSGRQVTWTNVFVNTTSTYLFAR